MQHHHAHIASCLADNGEPGPVIGVAFDGLGYGTDGTIWGGEFLVADLITSVRMGHLDPVPLPGGTAAIKQPWRMRPSTSTPPTRAHRRTSRSAAAWPAVLAVAGSGVNSPLTSSAGRLFDAVSALLGTRDRINYEGQAAVELEQLADPVERDAYLATVTDTDPVRIAGTDLVRAAAEDLRGCVAAPVIAARFHNGVADTIVATCLILRDRTGLRTVALSGGVFQNLLLLTHCVDRFAIMNLRYQAYWLNESRPGEETRPPTTPRPTPIWHGSTSSTRGLRRVRRDSRPGP